MLRDYFKIIRNAILENRSKCEDQYYESHHIVPKCMNKNSSTVLLTAIEHYKVHKILAKEFKDHTLYGEKLMWAFHRMSYDGKRNISESEYQDARLTLMPLWKRKKKESWKKSLSEKMKGNKNGLGCKNNWIPTEEQRKNISTSATKSKLGKIGEESRASKGIVICENKITGEKIEAGSALQLSKKLGNIHYSVIHEALNGSNYTNYKPRDKRSKYYQFLQDHKIYYK
jgi:hypothetical protein